MRALRHLFAVLLFATMSVVASVVHAQVSETQVKAAFLPRFARYVTWPSNVRPAGAEPMTLCVIGRDPFGRLLDGAAASQAVDGRRIVIRRISQVGKAGGCHIAFLQGDQNQSTGQMLAALAGRPVLTVTDARAGPQRGIVHFLVVDGRVRFFIDQARAERQNLAISSRLLALAVRVAQ